MVSLVMLAIMAGCAAFLFLKGTLALGIAMVLNALIAGFVAMGYYERLAGLVIEYSPGIAVWAHMIAFLLLFILAFAILQAIVMTIGKDEKIDFGKLPEQIGRPVAGVLLGYVITGQLLLAVAMAPLPSQYPYPRFEQRNPDPSNPSKPLLNPDGFVAGLFGTVSKGSFSPLGEPRSFAVLRAGFVDQLHLNRLKIGQDVPMMTGGPVVQVPMEGGVWQPSEGLRDPEGRPVSAEPGKRLLLVRVNLRKNALKDAGKFTLSQIRLISKSGSEAGPLAGAGEAAYPIGYVGEGGRFERKGLGEIITIDPSQVEGDTITMDLGFQVPTSLAPTLLEFKRNDVVQVPSIAAPEDAPQPIPFGGSAPSGRSRRETQTRGGQPQDDEPASRSEGEDRPRRGLSDTSRSIVGPGFDEGN